MLDLLWQKRSVGGIAPPPDPPIVTYNDQVFAIITSVTIIR